MLGQIIDRVVAISPQLAVCLSAFPVIYGVFAWVEERTSAEAKRDIALWLRNFGGKAIESSVLLNVRQFHDKMFGPKQFSLRCLKKTFAWSLISFVISFVICSLLYGFGFKLLVEFERNIIYHVLLSALVFLVYALPADYIGVGATRYLVGKLKDRISLLKGLSLISIDIMVKVSVLTLIFSFFFALLVFVYESQLISDYKKIYPSSAFTGIIYNVTDLIGLILEFTDSKPASMTVMLSMFVCSMWVWIYFFGLHALKRLHALGLRTMRILVWFLDIEKQPIRSVGVVAAGAITLVYALGALALGAK